VIFIKFYKIKIIIKRFKQFVRTYIIMNKHEALNDASPSHQE
jgi:hypothetical protein